MVLGGYDVRLNIIGYLRFYEVLFTVVSFTLIDTLSFLLETYASIGSLTPVDPVYSIYFSRRCPYLGMLRGRYSYIGNGCCVVVPSNQHVAYSGVSIRFHA